MVCFHGMRVSRLAERFSPEKGSRGVSSRDTPLLTFHGNRAAHFFQQGQVLLLRFLHPSTLPGPHRGNGLIV